MKNFLIIIFYFFFQCNLLYAEEIYYACVNKMVEDRGTSKAFNVGEKFGFQYFKLDTKKSKITIHEQMGDEKPSKIGSKKVEFVGMDSVEFKIDKSEGSSKMIDTFRINSLNSFKEQDGDGFSFTATYYIKHRSTLYDYDYESDFCIGPLKEGSVLKGKKAKKEYRRWIKTGY